MSHPNTLKKIALITCSTRKPRANPFVTKYVHSVIAPLAQKNHQISLEILDLADQSLPLFDEPKPPAQQPATDPTSGYKLEHTRAWSRKINSIDAFVFVTPEYNYSIPASLKNALDVLYHEWIGKPAAIVSYGGGGGVNSAEVLRNVLTKAFKMQLTNATIAPALTKAAMLSIEAPKLGRIPDEKIKAWQEDGSEDKIRQTFEELVKLLHKT
ncbi:hypothetical protein BGZ83_008048 [Gryganskiella cystojenkinii]|nr:hypothetical protein BGZ83_008048 [Gryganskiella cystojenkinii]